MSEIEERNNFFENYIKLKAINPDIKLTDCMSEEMKNDFDIDKTNMIKNSKECYNLKKFNYDSLSENKSLSELSEDEFEFRYPNYLFHYSYEYAENNLQVAIVNFLNSQLLTFFDEPFKKMVTLNDLCVDYTIIVIYNDHREIIINSDAFYIPLRLKIIIRDNEACLLEYYK